MRRFLGYVSLIFLLVMAGTTTALSTPPPVSVSDTYFIYDIYGGTWSDANKTGIDDSLMCWAATASNILAWGQWGTSAYDTSAEIFQEIKDHWTDNTGSIYWAEKYWFDGSPPPTSNYSYIDVQGGGNFYPDLNFWDYFYSTSKGNVMANIDNLLHQGKGVGLGISRGGAVGHAVTVWGYRYSPSDPDYYTSLFITDSDDNYLGLREYALTFQDNTWYLGGGYNGWWLGNIQALGYFTTPGTPSNIPSGGEVPIAPTWVLFGTGVFSLYLMGARRRG